MKMKQNTPYTYHIEYVKSYKGVFQAIETSTHFSPFTAQEKSKHFNDGFELRNGNWVYE